MRFILVGKTVGVYKIKKVEEHLLEVMVLRGIVNRKEVCVSRTTGTGIPMESTIAKQ